MPKGPFTSGHKTLTETYTSRRKASGNQVVQYTGKQSGEGSVVASRVTAEVHASGHTYTKSIRLSAVKQDRGKVKTETDKVLDSDVFTTVLDAVPVEDWCRTWAAGRTIMLRWTSKKVKEVVDKVRLPTVVRWSRNQAA